MRSNLQSSMLRCAYKSTPSCSMTPSHWLVGSSWLLEKWSELRISGRRNWSLWREEGKLRNRSKEQWYIYSSFMKKHSQNIASKTKESALSTQKSPKQLERKWIARLSTSWTTSWTKARSQPPLMLRLQPKISWFLISISRARRVHPSWSQVEAAVKVLRQWWERDRQRNQLGHWSVECTTNKSSSYRSARQSQICFSKCAQYQITTVKTLQLKIQVLSHWTLVASFATLPKPFTKKWVLWL